MSADERAAGATKGCARCQEPLCHALFAPDPARTDGLDSYCRPCRAAYNRSYREEHRDAINAQRRERRAAARARRALRFRRAQQRATSAPPDPYTRRQRRLVARRRYRAEHRDAINAYQVAWFHRHKEARAEHRRRYRERVKAGLAGPAASGTTPTPGVDPASSDGPPPVIPTGLMIVRAPATSTQPEAWYVFTPTQAAPLVVAPTRDEALAALALQDNTPDDSSAPPL